MAAKKFKVYSYNDTITFKPLNMFRCVTVEINGKCEIYLDIQNIQELISFLELQLRKRKRIGNKYMQRFNRA
jgi:hypothetical protein